MKTTSWKPANSFSEEKSSALDLTENGFIHLDGNPASTKGTLISLIFLAVYFTLKEGVSSLVTDIEGNELLNIDVKKGVVQQPQGNPYVVTIALMYNSAYNHNLKEIYAECYEQAKKELEVDLSTLKREVGALNKEKSILKEKLRSTEVALNNLKSQKSESKNSNKRS